MRKKIFITAALNGEKRISNTSSFSKDNAEEAVRAYEAGAAVVCVYVGKQEEGEQEDKIEPVRRTIEFIRSRCDAICCIKTGVNGFATLDEQLVPIVALKPEMAMVDIAYMNRDISNIMKMSSTDAVNQGPGNVSTSDYLNSERRFKQLEKGIRRMNENGTQPEFVVYDVATISSIEHLVNTGIIKTPVYVQFVLGIAGGMPATVDNLFFLYHTACRRLGDGNFFWSVGAVGENQMMLASVGLALGGNIQLAPGKGQTTLYALSESETEIIAAGRDIATLMGYQVASSADVRKMMSLKGADKVVI